ncbi:F-box domain protein [Ancylostoma caninum]|uniref:F-box domain protein n=1 Tax=Ancylostoma caninum TaxID=29170 RepID=A0A368H4W4_ANCCA|nr:F-box domain protein [Ancylostoma caninum]
MMPLSFRMRPQTSLDHLPDELIQMLNSFLTYEESISFTQCSRRLHRAIRRSVLGFYDKMQKNGGKPFEQIMFPSKAFLGTICPVFKACHTVHQGYCKVVCLLFSP